MAYRPIYDINELPSYTNNDVEKILTRLSYSKLATLFSCPKFFELIYLCKLKAPLHPKTSKGIKLHSFYSNLNQFYDEDKLKYTELYKQFFQTYKEEAIKYTKQWLPFKNKLKENNYNFYYETHLKVELTNLFMFPCALEGYIDFLAINQNETEAIIVDYKSSEYISPEYIDQAILYALLVFSNYPNVNKIETIIFDVSDNFLRNFISSNNYNFEKEDIENIEKTLFKIIKFAKEIIEKRNFYISPSKKCFSCPLISCKYNRLNPDIYDVNKKELQEIAEDTYLKDKNINLEEKPLLEQIISSKK